jgi:hypothetical protein
MLKLINGSQKKKPDMSALWLNAFGNSVEKRDTEKIIVSGVKYINASRPDKDKLDSESVQHRFAFIQSIDALMCHITPKQFMQLFPLKKEYDGKRFGCKDYFSAMEYIGKLDQDKPIGDGKKLFDFLWEYWNWDINEFLVEIFSTMDDLMHLQGKDGPTDKLIDDLGITPYYIQKDETTGQEYLLNGNTGKTAPISKSVPRYLKVIK